MKPFKWYFGLLLGIYFVCLGGCETTDETLVYGSLRSIMGKRILCAECYWTECDCTPYDETSFNRCHNYCYEYWYEYLYVRCKQEMPEEGKGSLNALLAGCYAIADYATEEEEASCEALSSSLKSTSCP